MILHTLGDHYDEETLIRVAEASGEIDDPHLHDCDDCRMAVDQYREMLSCVDDESVWDHRPIDDTPNPQTIATLRAFVEEMHREDAEAEPLVAELLAGSREEWMPRLMADPKYRTAGVVRKLIGMMPTAVQEMPANAVEVAVVASSIADSIDANDVDGAILRAAAWRERAYALFYAGDVATAYRSVNHAEALLSHVPSAAHDRARVALVKALILRQTDRLDEALALALESEAVFESLGEVSRAATARSVTAYVLSERRDFRKALAITRATLEDPAAGISPHARATLTMNAAYYERELGNVVEALQLLDLAAFMFDETGSVAEATRARWNVAAILRANGQAGAAEARIREVIDSFESLGMRGTAAVALLDLAEISIERADYAAAEGLCRRALFQFENVGLGHSSRAMMAISYLNDCCRQRKATAEVARHVRKYVEALPRQPNLLFATLSDDGRRE